MIEALQTLAVFNKLPETKEMADINTRFLNKELSVGEYYYQVEQYVANYKDLVSGPSQQVLKGI